MQVSLKLRINLGDLFDRITMSVKADFCLRGEFETDK